MTGALHGLKVLDLSRILAGPTCTQLLGDLGADVIKIENPVTHGDDTRTWGPPYAKDATGQDTDLSAYFNCANRNKRSFSINISTQEGQAEIKRLAAKADVLVENFKPGGLAKYGLDYEGLKAIKPDLIYCSISGFGKTGPNAHKPGYDLMAQGFGGIMSLTGDPDGPPTKVAVGVADVMCGMYATVGILAALRHRDQTGEGQQIDLALVDTQMAWLINEGTNFLTSGELPKRRGNQHPNIAPYQVFEVADGHVIIAVGNDTQFKRFCATIGQPDLAVNPLFQTNPDRLANREALIQALETSLRTFRMEPLILALEAARVPVGPVNTLDKVFASDQATAREMRLDLTNEALGAVVPVIGNPLKFSKTPVKYTKAPPAFGQDDSDLHEDDPWRDLSQRPA